LAGDDILYGRAGNDLLYGGDGFDSIFAGADNDVVYGDAGDDYIDGSTGDDVLYGGADNDTVLGGTGFDKLFGDDGNDSLNGGSEKDTLYGGAGNDTLLGGTGTDMLYGGDGDDSLNGGGSDGYYESSMTFESLYGGNGNDVLRGGTGGLGMGLLYGEAGNDILYSGSAGSNLNGGAGNDRLIGTSAYDIFTFDGEFGRDTVVGMVNATPDGATFSGQGINQLWFTKSGNNLLVSAIGTTNNVTFSNWYLSDQYRTNIISTLDNKLIRLDQVNNLVSAMAALTPPSAGQTTLTQSYLDALSPVIQAAWGAAISPT
jgi:Ca2+-binding RTX toxin-like protein